MHITILSFFSGTIQRGVEVYVNELSKRLSNSHQVTVFTSRDLPFKVSPYENNPSPILRRLYLDKTSLTIRKATKHILKRIKQDPPDILYPLNNGWQSLLAKRFCAHHKTKLLLAGHSGPGWDDRVNLLLRPDVFLVFSQAQQQWASRLARGVKVVKIHHSVDLKKFAAHKTKLKLKLQSPIFVTVSALSPKGRGGSHTRGLIRSGETNKHVGATIRAIAALDQGSLLLIGSGTDSSRIDKLANSLLGSKRYQRITVSHNIINQYYSASDVFTLASSSSEAFGLSYLEAMATNLPVVTTDDSLRREIIGNAGVFIKHPQDQSEYSRGLKQAVSTHWGNKPISQAKRFSWDNAVDKYQSMLKDIQRP